MLVVCHPENLELLRKTLQVEGSPSSFYGSSISGIKVVSDSNCPKTRKEWRPPKETHWDYSNMSESTRRWMLYFGYGEWHDTGEPAFFRMETGLGGLFSKKSTGTLR